jgi:hypothetical protein
MNDPHTVEGPTFIHNRYSRKMDYASSLVQRNNVGPAATVDLLDSWNCQLHVAACNLARSRQPITWTYTSPRMSASSSQGCRPSWQAWFPEHHHRTDAVRLHATAQIHSLRANASEGDTTCGSQKGSRAHPQHHESHTRVSSFAIAAHDLEAATESRSVIALHMLRRQFASLKLHSCSRGVKPKTQGICKARTVNLQVPRADVSHFSTSL